MILRRRRFSYAEILDMLQTARTNEYRNEPMRAECVANTMERCLELMLRNLADGESKRTNHLDDCRCRDCLQHGNDPHA